MLHLCTNQRHKVRSSQVGAAELVDPRQHQVVPQQLGPLCLWRLHKIAWHSDVRSSRMAHVHRIKLDSAHCVCCVQRAVCVLCLKSLAFSCPRPSFVMCFFPLKLPQGHFKCYSSPLRSRHTFPCCLHAHVCFHCVHPACGTATCHGNPASRVRVVGNGTCSQS